ncbi:pantetheine-phosphate adenylyltransferase, partial [Halanaerobium sp.]|uniref:pantetheine-phosphate adenylyltransferase n=1 Tax=Halanaerobium sp. TaxID=1895664 RepID=UPI000DE6F606
INTYFSPKERRDMIVENISEEIEVEYYEGLLIDFMQKVNSNLIVKELRSLSDFELEFQKALMNKKLDENIETILLTSELKYNYLSSDLVREISESKAKVKEFVPENVQDKLKLN